MFCTTFAIEALYALYLHLRLLISFSHAERWGVFEPHKTFFRAAQIDLELHISCGMAG